MPPSFYSQRTHPLLILIGTVIMLASFVALAAVFSIAAERAMHKTSPGTPLVSQPATETVAQPERQTLPSGQAG